MFNDKLNEECGIFGGYTNQKNITQIIIEGLSKLQHRGQESSGIAVGTNFQTLYKNLGLVKDVFKKLPSDLKGNFGIGHVRYSTQGKSDIKNAQPILINNISIVHNGNIKLANKDLSISDTEIMLQKIISAGGNFSFEEVGKCLSENFSNGAYSIALFLPERILAYRDANGFRPLFLCEAKEGCFIASEDVAFEHLDKVKITEIQAGFGAEITKDGYKINKFATAQKETKCVFEPIYFSSSKSHVFGIEIAKCRQKLGELLAAEDNIKADIVVPVPQSGVFAALGYSIKAEIPYKQGILINKELGRSFILPNQQERVAKVQAKLKINENIIKNKRIILVDDSIVRGTTSKEVIKMLKTAGAKEIHFRLSSPKLVNTCFWGVDIPTHKDLLAYSKTEEEIAQEIGADSVKFIPLDTLKEFFGENGWCYNCFIATSGEKKCDRLTKIQVSV